MANRNGYAKLEQSVERDMVAQESECEMNPEEEVRCTVVEQRIFRKHAYVTLDDEPVIPMKNVKEAIVTDLKFKGKFDWDEFVDSCDLNNDTYIDWKEFQLMVNTLLVKEARDFTTEAEEKIQALKDVLHDYKQTKIAANKLTTFWQTMTPRKFLRWFEALEDPERHEDRIRMLDSLVFTVPLFGNDGKWQAGIGNRQHISFGKYKGNVMAHDDVVVIESETTFPLPNDKPSVRTSVRPRRNSILSSAPNRVEVIDSEDKGLKIDFKGTVNRVDNFLLGQMPVPYQCAFTSVALFDPLELPFVVREIENASVESRVFDTPIVNAILTEAWKRSQWVFYSNVLVDVLVITLLSRFAVDARNKKMASPLTVGMLVLCSAYHFIGDVVEFIMPFFRPGGKPWDNASRVFTLAKRSVMGSFWSMFEVAMSVYFFSLSVTGLSIHWHKIFQGRLMQPHKADWFYYHPMWLVALLGAKTTHLIIKLLSVRAMGQRIVPAYDAMTHASSKAFLCFLLIMYCNVVLTFQAVPIKIYDPPDEDASWWDPWENLFDAFVLQFHGVFLGASSPGEVEQENQRLKLSKDHGVETGEIFGPSTHSNYHHGVQLLNIGYLILIHIIMLNVYIGVLGERYNRAVKRHREHFEKFRAVFTRKTVTRWMCCMKRRYAREHGFDPPLQWIAYKKREFRDPGAIEGSKFVMKLLRVVEQHVDQKLPPASENRNGQPKEDLAAAKKRLDMILSSVVDTLELL